MIVPVPVGKYVDASGTLLSSSASAITTFDSSTPFGCERKSWFEVRAGLKGAPTKSLLLGDKVHKQIEHYLLTKQDALGNEARAGKGIIDELTRQYPVYQIERWIESFYIDSVMVRGKIDFTGRHIGSPLINNITDWKTSSDIQKWGKTSSMLRKDTQMLIYRAAAEAEGCDETLEMNHVYFGTVKRESETVRTTINRQQLADGIGDIRLKLTAMKLVMRATNSEDVTPDRAKCNSCPYQIHCPSKGAFAAMSSLTDRFKKKVEGHSNIVVSPEIDNPSPTPIVTTKATPIPDPMITVPSRRKLVINDVLPPDAPMSNPASAAKPVEGFSSIPAPLKKVPPAPPEQHNEASVPKPRGKPVKAKEAAPVEVLGKKADYEISEVTVMVGATVKAIPGDPKCFEFLKIDVTLRATVKPGSDVQAVRVKLAEECQVGLVEELERRMPK